ncbi:MAG: arylsulfatase, partial [Acidimicrobiia bacterium]|nr:arylsulfatase [Acidimicrobiia bacterium]
MPFDPIVAETAPVADHREPVIDHPEQTAAARARLEEYYSKHGRNPNFCWILFDDVGWGDFGCY